MSVEKVLATTLEEFAKTYEGVTINYTPLLEKAEKAGAGVEILTIPKFIQRAVMLAYQAGSEEKPE